MGEPNHLGHAVRAGRHAVGMSQRELAERVGVGFPYVSKIESGQEVPSPDTLFRIASMLRLDMVDLIGDPDLVAARDWLKVSRGRLQVSRGRLAARDTEAERIVSVLVDRFVKSGAWR